MNVCPFCNKATAVSDPQMPCRSCGRRASDHPSALSLGGRTVEAGGGWDDDDLGGGLELSRGGSFASHASGPSAYAGGGLSLGDDDPFADDALQGAGALELDLPPAHTANAPRSSGPAPTPSGPPPTVAASGAPPPSSVPDLVLPPKLQPAPRSPQSAPALEAAQAPRSAPAPVAPPPSAPAPAPAVAPPPASDPALGPPPRSEPSFQVPPSQPQLPAVAAAPRPRGPADPAAAMIARYPVAPEKVWEAPAYAMKVLWRQFELRQDLASLRRKRSPDVPLYERALRTHDAKTFALGLAITCAGLALASFIFFLPVILRFLRAPD